MLHGDTTSWPDRPFYFQLIQTYGQPALDIGCGTGRLLLDYLAQGIDSDGIDNSPDMLAICRQKATNRGLAPTLYEQYLETITLPRQYRVIMIPSSTLQLVIEPELVTQALQRLYRQLEPGGVAVSFMALWQPGDPLSFAWERTAVRPDDGMAFRRVSRSWHELDSEVEHTENHYQLIIAEQVVAEEVHRRSPATRSYTQPQARAAFERAGFSPVELYGQFTFAPANAGDTVFTVVGHKQ